MARRPTICWFVVVRWERAPDTKLKNQWTRVPTCDLKPTMYSRCRKHHAAHAVKPVRCSRPIFTTALKRAMVAMEPLSK